MTSESYNTKQIYFKAYEHLFQLEDDLKLIRDQNPIDSKISVLGKAAQFYIDKNIEVSKDTNAIKTYWKKVLGDTTDFGSFINPDLGHVFITGVLAPTFLYELDGKTLGMLSAGPYGILRGIGASEIEVTTHLKKLYNNNYLLIFRGSGNTLKNYKKILETKVNE